MTLLVVGLSHRSAPVDLLEEASLTPEAVEKLLDDVHGAGAVSEAVVVSTCNRLEVYADVGKFHAGVEEVSELLARHGGLAPPQLTSHLYVHYEDRAVHHLFAVAAGLDSMVVGEAQILGQVKEALRVAQAAGTAAQVLNELFQAALRVGKRAHTETDIDSSGRSLVTVGIAAVGPVLQGVAGARALVVGAGSMASLAATTLRRAGAGEIVVANRSAARGGRLADAVSGRAVGLDSLVDELAAADVVVSCTGAVGVLVDVPAVAAAVSRRGGRPLAIVDLALPHDVDPAVRDLDGVVLVDLASLARQVAPVERVASAEQVRAIVSEEVADFVGARRADRVAPTVVALRSMADDVVSAELARLTARLPGLDESVRDEVAATVRRVVGKLLHSPTVRVKELAALPGGAGYEAALRELFALDPRSVSLVASPTPEADGGTGGAR